MQTIIINWQNEQLQSIQTNPDKMLCYNVGMGSLRQIDSALRSVDAVIVRDDASVAMFEVTPDQSRNVMAVLCGWPQ